jgi:hypothetical protein
MWVHIKNEVIELTEEEKKVIRAGMWYTHSNGVIMMYTGTDDVYWAPCNAVAAKEFIDELKIKELK